MITVECRGEQCPIPVVKTIKAIGEMKEVDTVQTHVDNETAVQNLTKLAESKGFAVKSEKIEDKHFVVTMEVTAPGAAAAAEEPAVSCIPDRRGSTVYAFGTNVMGGGNDELGATLMKGFIYAVSQLDELPKTMLFYNGGAKLTVEGSASLEDLKSLQAQGVEILTCGTCLNFYDIKEKIATGRVGNMFLITELMAGATSLVKP